MSFAAAAKSLRTVHGDDDDDYADEVGSQASHGSSKTSSVGNWEGALGDVPEYLYFSEDRCRVIFNFKDVSQALVCGNVHKDCRRSGHGYDAQRAPCGYYKTLIYRKKVEGIYSSHLTPEAYEAKEAADRSQMREYTKELGSAMFSTTPPSQEVKFEAGTDTLAASGDPDKPFDQKKWEASVPVKAQPIWDMKPKVPGISIPVPKQQGSIAANPSTVQPAQGAQDDLKAVAEAMMTVIQSFGQRIEKVEKDAGHLRTTIQDGQEQTNQVLNSLQQAILALGRSTSTAPAPSPAPSPAPAPAPAPMSSFSFVPGPTPAPAPVSMAAPASASVPTDFFGRSTGGSAPVMGAPFAFGGAAGATGTGTTSAFGFGPTARDDRSSLPPASLLASDRSKEKDMVFDVRLRSESQMKRDFSPSGTNSGTRDDLAANMVDVVALPGTFSGSK